jgi:cell wall-associated NlpC family hydrolase
MRKYLFLLLLSCTFLFSCSSAKVASNKLTVEQKLTNQYNQYKGTKYKYGGTDKRGFDCSGFTQKVYKNAFQIELPRTAKEISAIGKKVSKNKLKPGDLVFFRPSRKYKHMGIYMGEDMFMHSSTSKGVTKSDLNNPYWEKKYRYAKRILKSN